MQLTRDLVGCHVFPVHRLDRPTSGVLLFAKSSEVANALCEQFAEHSIEKQYLALVRGNMHESGILDYPSKLNLMSLEINMPAKIKQHRMPLRLLSPYSMLKFHIHRDDIRRAALH